MPKITPITPSDTFTNEGNADEAPPNRFGGGFTPQPPSQFEKEQVFGKNRPQVQKDLYEIAKGDFPDEIIIEAMNTLEQSALNYIQCVDTLNKCVAMETPQHPELPALIVSPLNLINFVQAQKVYMKEADEYNRNVTRARNALNKARVDLRNSALFYRVWFVAGDYVVKLIPDGEIVQIEYMTLAEFEDKPPADEE